jgi:hypothetical protein
MLYKHVQGVCKFVHTGALLGPTVQWGWATKIRGSTLNHRSGYLCWDGRVLWPLPSCLVGDDLSFGAVRCT